MKQLIITADDFGLCTETNQAVIQACEKGVLTCASLMVSGRAAKEAVWMAKQNPALKVGLHLVLADGLSVLPAHEIPALVDTSKQFSRHIVLSGIRRFFSKEHKRQIAKECEAQIRSFLDTGLEMDHLNSHNHLHIHPAILDIVLPLARKYGIKAIRLPFQKRPPLRITPFVTAAAMSPWVRRLRIRLIQAGITFNRAIFGLHETGHMTEAAWMRIIPRIEDGLTEVYCHPAIRKTAALREAMPAYRNEDEFCALLSPRIREGLEDGRIIRTTFTEIGTRPASSLEN